MRRSPAAVFLLLCALMGSLVMPGSAQARPDVVLGIEQFGNMENPQYTGLFQDTMRQDGARIIRYVVRWDWVAQCDPRTRGNAADMDNPCYSWGLLDHVVRNADQRGLKVLFSIYGTPEWKFGANDNFTGSSDADYASFVADYADFAQAVATRFDGRHGLPRVEQITVWNEPNGSFFQPRMVAGELVGPARYARLYDAAARKIKAVDATLRVAPGPTAPHASSLPPMKFWGIVLPLLDEWGTPVDGIAHNAYTGRQSPLNSTIKAPYVGLGNVDDLTRLMDRYGASKGRPIWITEFGYQTSGGQKAIEEHEQPALLADALYFAWKHPRIETFIWYLLHDDPEGSPYAFMTGLYRNVETMCGQRLCAKPGAAMFRHTLWNSGINARGVVALWAQGRMQPAETKVYVQRPGDGWRAYANPDTAQTGTVRVTMRLPAGTIVMTCDVRCGPQVTLQQPVKGGGGTQARRAKVQRLPMVRLSKRLSLRNGITYGVNCSDCRVAARIIARGPLSGIRSARTKARVVGYGRVTKAGDGQRVLLRYNAAAKREIARARSATAILRTYITYRDGAKIVTDRPVRLM